MEDVAWIVEAIVPLLQALVWPAFLLFAVLYFRKPLREFLENLGDFTLRVGASGLEATASRRKMEAAAMLGAATAARGEAISASGTANRAREIADLVDQAAKPRQARRLAESHVLWVDDRPSNNVYERMALERLGITVTTSTSTEDALERIENDRFDVIISDMGRPPDSQAGYTLLDDLRNQGMKVPFVIYTASSPPETRAAAKARGAFGQVSSPGELVQMVVDAIQGRQKAGSW